VNVMETRVQEYGPAWEGQEKGKTISIFCAGYLPKEEPQQEQVRTIETLFKACDAVMDSNNVSDPVHDFNLYVTNDKAEAITGIKEISPDIALINGVMWPYDPDTMDGVEGVIVPLRNQGYGGRIVCLTEDLRDKAERKFAITNGADETISVLPFHRQEPYTIGSEIMWALSVPQRDYSQLEGFGSEAA